ncbi:PEP-CTERM-box response regulator transcription factor [Desulfovibrio caledoniensis]
MQKLLIIDDNDEILRQLKWGLSKSNYELIFARDGEEGLKLFKKHSPAVVTLDLGLPPHENGIGEGLRCLGEMLRMDPTAKVIVITGNEEKDAALQAVRLGAYDYYKKPVNLDELKVMVDRAMYLQNIESENQELRRKTVNESGIVGECARMQVVFNQIDRVAASDVPVLICGESGTGKELVARAVHQKSLRSDMEMVSINCGAIPENLLESELFGHEKGAFTGANKLVKGKVEYADKGTLFLDEIGEMPMTLQVKLLRFLQEMVVTRVGGRKEIPVDVRIITATNIDIQKAMEEGAFREDLFYRVGVMTINLPPLRERGDDIELLANYFLKSVSVGQRTTSKRFSDEALACIKGYEWPGNIRELENRVKRAVIMATGPEILPEDLGMKGDEALRQKLQTNDISLKDARFLLERDMVENALEKFSGNIVKAAASIGVSRPTFYDLMKKHGLKSS